MSSSDQNNQRESPTAPTRRRSSFVDMFNPRASLSQNLSQNQNPGPRRLSITTLGLSTLPGAQTSPFTTIRNRTESVSSANSGSVDESPFEDDAAGSPSQNTATSVPVTPFGRRMSFGAARALRGPSNGQNGASPNGQNEGFDFAEQMRQRAERSSISSGTFGMTSPHQMQPAAHHRSKSVATMEPPPKSELPKPATRPDAFQERILKGDFYMD
jgi:hypothetical protein